MSFYNFPLGVSHYDPNFKKITEIIAGFRGYETLEDLKAADGQVRRQLAWQLDKAIGEADDARRAIAGGTHLRTLPDFDAMVGRIRSARESLAGGQREKIAACLVYRPERNAIGEIYGLDFRMLRDVENVYNLMQEFARISQENQILANNHKIDVSLREIVASMDKREQIIGCMIE